MQFAKRSRRIARFAASMIVATALAGGGLLAGAPAAEAVGCWGDYCSGADPMESGCASDAVTFSAVDAYNGRLELRWSPTCKTEWARYTQYPSGSFTSGDEAPISVSAVQDSGYTQSVSADGAEAGAVIPDGTYWTPMIYSPVRLVRAELFYPCGAERLVAAAIDCGLNNGLAPEATEWK